MSAFMNTELQKIFLKVKIKNINLINEILYLSTKQAVKTALTSEFLTNMKLQRASTDNHENGYQNGKNIMLIK